MSEYLFVYGTLRRGARNPFRHTLARAAEYLGAGKVSGYLIDLGAYPGLCLSAGQHERVMGEIYRLPEPADALLASLDRYEGCGKGQRGPQEYRRERVTVDAVALGPLSAWTYVYQGRRSGPRVANGDWGPRLRRVL